MSRKIHNLVLNFKSVNEMYAMKAQYDYIGRESKANADKLELTVFALPQNSKKKRKQEAKLRRRREERFGNEDNYSQYSRKYETD